MTSPANDPLAESPELDAAEERHDRLELDLEAPEIDPETGEPIEEPTEQEAILRTMPRIEVFLAVGAVIGLVLAIILTNIQAPAPTEPGAKEFSPTQVFGFLAVILVPVCLGLAGLLATFLGRGRGKRVKLVKGADDTPLHSDR